MAKRRKRLGTRKRKQGASREQRNSSPNIERDLGRRRITGARGRKLGPVYPSTLTPDSSHDGISHNVRYFYKTKGFGHKKSVKFALDFRDAESVNQNT